MSNKFTCFVIGEDSLLIKCSETLLNKGHKIFGIIASNPAIKKWASEKKINIYELNSNLSKVLASEPYDYLFSITNLSVLADNVINSPQKAAINFHDGPLPRYAGINATSWALMNLEKTYAVTWHEITSDIDKGDILKQVHFNIDQGEIALSLNAKCFEAGAAGFEELVDELTSGTLNRIKQDLAKRSYFGKFKRPESAALIDWYNDAERISSFVRSLNFGRYRNPLGLPKIKVGTKFFIIPEIEITSDKSRETPGTITAINDGYVKISTKTNDVKISKVLSIDGLTISLENLIEQFSLQIGTNLNQIDSETSKSITVINSIIAEKEDYWVKELTNLELINVNFAKRNSNLHSSKVIQEKLNFSKEVLKVFKLGENQLPVIAISLFAIFMGRHSGRNNYTLGFSNDELNDNNYKTENLFAKLVPVQIEFNPDDSFSEAIDRLTARFDEAIKNKTYVNDIFPRHPELHHFVNDSGEPVYPVAAVIINEQSEYKPESDNLLTFVISSNLKTIKFIYNSNAFSGADIKLLKAQFTTFFEQASVNQGAVIAKINFISPEEKKKLFEEWNNTKTDYPANKCIHQFFEEQVLIKPTAIAVACNGYQITYDELNKKADQLANYLSSNGIGANVLVGISLNRSINMIIAILGVLKAGGAYVPIDPQFPKDRIALMILDSECPIIITESSLKNNLESLHSNLICINTDWEKISSSVASISFNNQSSNLAYVIYTSGSTGKPKGVMVNHRNVVNFFAGMDQHIKYDNLSAWLAVTSLSFDISVLELLWTLTRGIKVVLYTGDDFKVSARTSIEITSSNKIDFSLFYFSSYEGEKSENKYKLLIEGAKFGDKNDFKAMWTPERHFYDFGGLYANPSITSAAISTITEKIKIRAGSVVSPLHSTIRIAEEWSMVDNLSEGRVAIAFAAGWQPNDFVIMPQNFDDRKNIMFNQVEEIQKMWQGQSVSFKNPNGKMVDIQILPKPVQKKLPVWITAAGNPETFEMAGKKGYNLLTHLLGQSVSEVAEKIRVYRKAWKEAGHEGEGNLTLMLHTFVGLDESSVKETVREPMKNYLRSAVNLVKEAAWSFPTFKHVTTNAAGNFSMDHLSAEDLDAVLDYSFERYYQTSGLFGTPESCLRIVEELKQIGVDEIACLIDFGIDSDLVLAHLHYLNQLRINSNANSTSIEISNESYSIDSLIRKHNITHMQCTPSMAKMLTMEESSTEALISLKTMLIGGETFPVNLAKKLLKMIDGDLLNMYGPTETTIWSTLHKLSEPVGNSIPIGKPLANTQIYILDNNHQLVPAGIAGELCIGGDGVTNGYYKRSELTDDKFISNQFSNNKEKKIYRTGDLAYYGSDGIIEFLGRLDHQVKIRGYRIELGDIESQLSSHPSVSEAIVIAREDTPGDQRLVAYLIPSNGNLDFEALKEFLRTKLPEYMCPAHYISLTAFPLTPNGKIDRKAFPILKNGESNENKKDFVLPSADLEIKIASIWRVLLNLDKVGVKDNFFDIGGHSLLAVQLHSKLKQTVDSNLTLIDIFKYPTIHSLVAHINSKVESSFEPIIPIESKRVTMSKQRKSRLRANSRNNPDKLGFKEDFD